MKSSNPFSLYLLNLAKMCCYRLPNPGNMQPLLRFLLTFDFFDSRLRGKTDRCEVSKAEPNVCATSFIYSFSLQVLVPFEGAR